MATGGGLLTTVAIGGDVMMLADVVVDFLVVELRQGAALNAVVSAASAAAILAAAEARSVERVAFTSAA